MVLSMVCLPSFQVILLFSIHWASTGAAHRTSCWRLQLRAAISPRNLLGPGKLVSAWHSGPVTHKGENVNRPGGFKQCALRQERHHARLYGYGAARRWGYTRFTAGSCDWQVVPPTQPKHGRVGCHMWTFLNQGSALAPYAVLTCLSEKEQADSLCLPIIKGKRNVVRILARLKSFWLKITFMIAA